MTPICVAIPPVRALTPAVAFATGLVCEYRPNMAERVRAVVLGDEANIREGLCAIALLMALKGGEREDYDGLPVVTLMEVIVHGLDINALAEVLGLILSQDEVEKITSRDGADRIGTPKIGDVVQLRKRTPMNFHPCGAETYHAVGLVGHRTVKGYRAHDAAQTLACYLREGFAAAWAKVPHYNDGGVGALHTVVRLHAHTVSFDAGVRAAWAKAHIDALR